MMFGVEIGLTRRELLNAYALYCEEDEKRQQARRESFLTSNASSTNTIDADSFVAPNRRMYIKPLWNLFHSEKNGKVFRQLLDEYIQTSHSSSSTTTNNMHNMTMIPGKKKRNLNSQGYAYTTKEVICKAMECLSEDVLDQPISSHLPSSSNSI